MTSSVRCCWNAVLRNNLKPGVDALAQATEWMLDRLADDPNAAAAGCTPYLRMFSIVIGGYLMARSAVVARKLAGNGGADGDAFLSGKIATARFYGEQILPAAPALVGPATAGAETLYAIDAERMAI